MPGKKHFDFPYVGNSADTTVLFVGTTAAGPSNTTTATSLLGNGVGVKTLPAGFLSPGVTIQSSLNGFYSTATSTPGTLTLTFVIGGVVFATTGAVTLTAALTNLAFCIEAMMTCTQAGSSGQVWTQSIAYMNTAAQVQAGWQMVNTAVNTLDTTVAQTMDMQAAFSLASGSNVITCTNSLIQFYN